MRILRSLLLFSLSVTAFFFAGCSSTDYDRRMEQRASFSEEQDRRYDEWWNAIMQ